MTDATAPRTAAEVPGRVELAADATPEILDLVHGVTEHLWRAHPGVAEGDRLRFAMAVGEVLGNIVEHAYRLDGQPEPVAGARRFEVCLAVDDGRLLATFADNGLPLALDLSTVEMPAWDVESGRGLALAAQVLDELDYRREGGRNHWTLVCRTSG